MVKKSTSVLILVIALAAAVIVIPRLGGLVAGKRTPDVTLEDCWWETAQEAPQVKGEFNCGFIEVFEDRNNLKGRKIEIHFARFVATDDNEENEALFFFSGGPGEATIQLSPWIMEDFEDIRQHRDVVFVDIRGTGFSNPMACPIEGDQDDLQTWLFTPFDRGLVKACYEKAIEHADPRFYRTEYIAQDVNDVRRAIGYERIDLIGGSYGTRLAQVFMRRFPDNVRTATLKGPVRTGERMPSHFAGDTENALGRLIADCAKDPVCSATYPDFATNLRALIERIHTGPLTVDITLPEGGTRTVTVPEGLALSQLRNMLYWPKRSARMPKQVEALAGGDFTPFVTGAARYSRWVNGDDDNDPLVYSGLYFSVTCAEDVPFIDWGTARREAEDTMLGTFRLDAQQAACEAWPVPPADAKFLDLVESDIPTLIVVGEIDPATPPRNAEAVAAKLENVVVLEIQNNGHGIDAACVDTQITAFINEGELDAVNPACGRDLPRPPFIVPE